MPPRGGQPHRPPLAKPLSLHQPWSCFTNRNPRQKWFQLVQPWKWFWLLHEVNCEWTKKTNACKRFSNLPDKSMVWRNDLLRRASTIWATPEFPSWLLPSNKWRRLVLFSEAMTFHNGAALFLVSELPEKEKQWRRLEHGLRIQIVLFTAFQKYSQRKRSIWSVKGSALTD